MKRTNKKADRLASQLQNRKQNLAVIEETMKSDPGSEHRLEPVKEFLNQRIESLELALKRN